MYHDNVVFVLFYTFDSGMIVLPWYSLRNWQKANKDGTTIVIIAREYITVKTCYFVYNTSYVTLDHKNSIR